MKFATRLSAPLVWGVLPMVALCMPGCRRDAPPGPELVVLCGNSFPLPAQELLERFTAETGIPVAMTAAGSADFLALVKAGQQGDILITHDPYLDYVREAGALADAVRVGVIAPVIVVQPGNPHEIAAIEDLVRPGLRVAVSDPEYSTSGKMVFSLLERKGLKEAFMRNVENRLTRGHGALGTLVQTGAVDAAIMWNGVAHTFGDAVEIVPTPYEYDTEVGVHVMGLSYSDEPELVQRFIDFSRRNAPEIFAGYGYTKEAR